MVKSILPLMIRADASEGIGVGHVMRCLALAQAWRQRAGQATFLTAFDVPKLAERIRGEGFQLRRLQTDAGSMDDAYLTVEAARQLGVSCIVVDGYVFGDEYQRIIKEESLRLLFIDDYGHCGHYCADLVLNQNVCATADLYPSCEQATRLLLGTHYALLRREFLPWRDWKRDFPKQATKLLVTLGGSDPGNLTLQVIRAIDSLDMDEIDVSIVLGCASPHFESLQTTCELSAKRIRLESNLRSMPEAIAWADLAVTAGGSTCYECAYLGLPNIIIQTAENQAGICRGMEMAGCSVFEGTAEQVRVTKLAERLSILAQDRTKREKMSRCGRALLDGGGGRAVTATLIAGVG